ncbi:MAG: LLM class flavin-dependent oxidoreductase [Actinomycetota bacterium]
MDIGIVVGGRLAGIEDAARRAEDAGFESVWVAETAMTAFIQAALVSRATSRVRVGTAVALAFPRSPTITAMNARDLAELSDGRFILGLGSQVKRVNEERFGVAFEHPAPKMGEYVEAVRAVLGAFDGSSPGHEGRFYRITMPPFPGASPAPAPIPIYLAAVNERMAETAGRIADGISGHPMNSTKYLSEVVVPAIERGARAAGRDPKDVSVTTNLITQVSKDGEEAKRLAAVQLAFYATTRSYAPVLAMHGFEDRVAPIREAHGRGDFAAMSELAAPMVDALTAAGSPDEVKERVASFEGIADRVILGGSWVSASPERAQENFDLLVETFSS